MLPRRDDKYSESKVDDKKEKENDRDKDSDLEKRAKTSNVDFVE